VAVAITKTIVLRESCFEISPGQVKSHGGMRALFQLMGSWGGDWWRASEAFSIHLKDVLVFETHGTRTLPRPLLYKQDYSRNEPTAADSVKDPVHFEFNFFSGPPVFNGKACLKWKDFPHREICQDENSVPPRHDQILNTPEKNIRGLRNLEPFYGFPL